MRKASDPFRAYQRAFFDRDFAEYTRTVSEFMAAEDFAATFVRTHFEAPGADDPIDKALRLDTTVMLVDDPVKRVDSMTMAWGLEARVPFLDHELVELAGRLPVGDKLADDGKGVLKSIARRVLPHAVVDRPKGYFPVPILKYIDGPVLTMIRDTLGSRTARERGLFRGTEIERLLAEPAKHLTPLRGSQLWQVALLELWLQRHAL
jgi:asparagine synthase (glutamine-hydrolysing)